MKEKQTGFAIALRKWRGKRTRQEAAQVLGIPWRTLEAYEQGWTAPKGPRLDGLLARMKNGRGKR